MSPKVTTTWLDNMTFDAVIGGHHILMDADPEWGGEDRGPRPKPLLLAALSGCSGLDVVSILNKMQITDYRFRMDLDADSTTEHPIVYHTIRFDFYFEGENLPQDKIVKAVKLSTERYCGVNEMLQKAAKVEIKIFINNNEVK